AVRGVQQRRKAVVVAADGVDGAVGRDPQIADDDEAAEDFVPGRAVVLEDGANLIQSLLHGTRDVYQLRRGAIEIRRREQRQGPDFGPRTAGELQYAIGLIERKHTR